MSDKIYVPEVRINGRETIDRSEYLKYIGDDIIDLEIVKNNIERFLYKYIQKMSYTSYEIPMMSAYAVETINDELYIRALLYHKTDDNIDYIHLLANRISALLSLNGRVYHSIKDLTEFLYTQIRK